MIGAIIAGSILGWISATIFYYRMGKIIDKKIKAQTGKTVQELYEVKDE